ncbi:MAG: 16S rRNA (guanine(527)-N(7))-methyltransferase RsmG [Gloeomargarita sp. GMQP_bins_5]
MLSPLDRWPGDPAQQDPRWQKLYDVVLRGNQRLNLTRITAPADFWEKHLWDSAQGIRPYLSEKAAWRVIDVGSGAGFPGVVVALLQPHWHVTLLEARQKKTRFLQELVAALGLPNVAVLTGRAEVLGTLAPHRQGYDLVLLRAVAPARQALAYGAPLVKPGGRLVLYQGQWTEQDTAALVPHRYGLQWEQIDAQKTPLTQAIRHYLHLMRNFSVADAS